MLENFREATTLPATFILSSKPKLRYCGEIQPQVSMRRKLSRKYLLSFMRSNSYVPGEILLEPTTESELEKTILKNTSVPTTILTNHTTRCTDIDAQKGRCHIIGFPPFDPLLHSAYIALSVILLTVGLVLTIALCCWRRSKKRRHEDLDETLTFSNPTYSASGDGVPGDRKVWPWKNQQREKQQQARLMGVCKEGGKLTHLEVSALVGHNQKMTSLGVPTPPQHHRQNFEISVSPCKHHQHSPMPYRTVETDI